MNVQQGTIDALYLRIPELEGALILSEQEPSSGLSVKTFRPMFNKYLNVYVNSDLMPIGLGLLFNPVLCRVNLKFIDNYGWVGFDNELSVYTHEMFKINYPIGEVSKVFYLTEDRKPLSDEYKLIAVVKSNGTSKTFDLTSSNPLSSVRMSEYLSELNIESQLKEFAKGRPGSSMQGYGINVHLLAVHTKVYKYVVKNLDIFIVNSLGKYVVADGQDVYEVYSLGEYLVSCV